MACADPDEALAWFRLVQAPGVGRRSARRLLAAFGSPQALWQAPPSAWRDAAGPAVAQALASAARADATFEARWRAARDWLDGTDDRRLLTLADADYPPLLLQTADPPLVLWAEGRLALADGREALAIVGSRHPTAQGLDNAHAFAAHLAGAGWVVVSGLATGIDAAAHEGALSVEGGLTVAVVGTGPDRVYPRAHVALARRIAARGLVLSEYPPGTPALPEHFPQRNRLIAGLARGTLVVEAALRSGSLVTARLAAESDREVFAVPGSIHAPQSRGCHALIKQGAKLVESAQDILEELRPAAAPRAAAPAPAGPASVDRSAAPDGPAAAAEPDDPLLRALGEDPQTLDALLARCGWPAEQATARLLELELLGAVARLPGGRFQRRHLV